MKILLLLVAGASWSLLFEANDVLAVDECKDNDSYRYYNDAWKDCKWVYDNDRCDRYDNNDDKHVGEHHCPKSCGVCKPSREDDEWNNDDDKSHDDDDFWKDDDDEWHQDDGGCYDDHAFQYDGSDWKDCKWLADQRLCDREHQGKDIGKNYCRYSCGYCDPDWQGGDEQVFCYKFDDEDFRYDGKDWKDCRWVADEGHCDWEHNGKNIGKNYCPWSCGHCDNNNKKPTNKPTRRPTNKPTRTPTRKPTSNHEFCYDDEHFYYNGDDWKDCSWVYKNDCCGRFKDGKKIGEYYCPYTCGYCEDWNKEPTGKPTSPSCHNDVDVEKKCYDDHDIDDLKVFFKSCRPYASDWIGIYEAHHNKDLGNTEGWWGNSFMWQYNCGSENCDYKKEQGTLHFEDWWLSLKKGEYRAYMFDENSYDVKAKSQSFQVGDCNGWNKDPTSKPTSSYCQRPSSVKVDGYCYKDRQPDKLKVFFENCHPEERDWVGIYKAHDHKNYVTTLAWWGNSHIWKFACGSQTCTYKKEDGTLYFEDWWSSLDDGEYQAYLFSDNGYHVKAESETFKVGNWC